jgi:hypothetical protein
VRFWLILFSAPARAKPMVYTTRSGLLFGREQGRSAALGVRLLWPSRGLVFLVETRPTHRCRRAGRIVVSLLVKRFFSSVNSRPTHRSRHALTPAESWPCPASSGFSLRSTRDRRIAPGVRVLRPNRGPAPCQAVTTISDRLGACAPKAIRAWAVTYRAEGHFGD